MNKEIVPNVLVAVIVGVGAYVITPFVKSTDAHAAASEMINTPPFKTSLVQGVVAKLAVDEGMREALLDAMKANDPDFRGLRGHPGGQGETGPGCEVGSVVAWPSNAEIPSGWMKCDGEPIDRMKYAKLFGILGVTYGGGDDVKTFNLPNFQGMFLRGEGRQVGKDGEERHVSGEFGDMQPDRVQDHTHQLPPLHHEVAGGQGSQAVSGTDLPGRPQFSTGGMNQDSTETRPANFAVHWIVRVEE